MAAHSASAWSCGTGGDSYFESDSGRSVKSLAAPQVMEIVLTPSVAE
jgi:hypothetical protein